MASAERENPKRNKSETNIDKMDQCFAADITAEKQTIPFESTFIGK